MADEDQRQSIATMVELANLGKPLNVEVE